MRERNSEAPLNDFSSIADVYDELVNWAPYETWVRRLEKRMRRWGLKPGDWMLDAACGTGLSTLPWLRRGYRVAGADASAPMLERAQRRAQEAGYEAEFRLQDLLALDLGRSFDAAVCMHSGLDYILRDEDLAQAFRSLRRCLRVGGLLAFDKCLDEPAFYKESYTNWRQLSCGRAEFRYRWDRPRRLMEQCCTVFREQGTGPPRTAVVYHLKAVPPDQLIAMVETAGFETLERPSPFKVADPGMGIFRAV